MALKGPVVGVAGAIIGAFVVVVVGVGCRATLIISKSSSGRFGMFSSLAADPLIHAYIAVVLYLARGAVAQTVLELVIHVVYGALIRYCRARGDAVLLLRVDLEDVVEPAGGVFCLGVSYWSMFSS